MIIIACGRLLWQLVHSLTLLFSNYSSRFAEFQGAHNNPRLLFPTRAAPVSTFFLRRRQVAIDGATNGGEYILLLLLLLGGLVLVLVIGGAWRARSHGDTGLVEALGKGHGEVLRHTRI